MFPQVAAVNGGNNPVNNTNHTVNLPAGINAGDLLLVFFASEDAVTITFPGGWTQLFQSTYENVTFGCWYRIANGGEGATINVTTSTAQMTAHTSYRITGYSGTPEAGTAVTGNTQYPDPPSLTPTWGAKDTLWFAAVGNENKYTTTGYPTNYTNSRKDFANDYAGCGVSTARRELNTISEDPGSFVLQYSLDTVTNTVAVQPLAPPTAAGGGAGGVTGAAGILLVGA